MDSKIFWTHWVIGICAVTIWAWGNKIGVAPSLQTYAAYTLPLLVGHAVGRSVVERNVPPPPPPAIPPVVVPDVPAAQPEQPTVA